MGRIWFAPLIFALLAVGCGEKSHSPDKPVVLVSVPPQGFFVEKIAGALVEVVVLIPPGASPATYEPTIQQMKAVSRAAVFVKVGHPKFPFERSWFDRLHAENPSLNVVDSSAGCPLNATDPHVWLSPSCARLMATSIETALAEIRPEHAATLEANLRSFLGEIDAIDVELRQMLRAYEGRKFFVFHPSWGYFARDYGLQQIAIEQEAKEPTLRDLSRLIELADAEGVRAIFVQPQFSRQHAELVADQISGRLVVIDPLAPDWLSNLRRVAAAFREAFKG